MKKTSILLITTLTLFFLLPLTLPTAFAGGSCSCTSSTPRYVTENTCTGDNIYPVCTTNKNNNYCTCKDFSPSGGGDGPGGGDDDDQTNNPPPNPNVTQVQHDTFTVCSQNKWNNTVTSGGYNIKPGNGGALTCGNKGIYFCAQSTNGNTTWKQTLDDEQWKQACQTYSDKYGMAFTGQYCCGEPAQSRESYTDVGTTGACITGTPVFNGETLHNKHTLINNGQIYKCGTYVTNHLTGYWLFNTTTSTAVRDISTNTNDGRVIGNPNRMTNTEKNAIYTFDGTNDYIQLNKTYNPNTITVLATIRTNGGTNANTFFSMGQNTNQGDAFEFRVLNSGHLQIGIKDNTTFDSITTTTTVNNGQWHTVAVTKQGRQATLYINGNKATQGRFNHSATPTVNNAAIASLKRQTVSNHYNGSIAQIAVFNTSLTPTEIQSISTIQQDTNKLLTRHQLNTLTNTHTGNQLITPTSQCHVQGNYYCTSNGKWKQRSNAETGTCIQKGILKTNKGVCPQGHCFVKETASPRCIENGVYSTAYDRYCNDGNWTSRTKYIAEAMQSITNNVNPSRYTLLCDIQSNTLVNDTFSGNIHKACSLHHTVGGDTVILGATLETGLPSYLAAVKSAYANTYTGSANITNTCNETNGPGNYTQCAKINTSEHTLNIYYDNQTRTVLYSDHANAVNPSWIQDVTNWLRSWIPLWQSHQAIPQIRNFNRFYYTYNEGTTISVVEETQAKNDQLIHKVGVNLSSTNVNVHELTNALNTSNLNVSGQTINITNPTQQQWTVLTRHLRLQGGNG